MIPNALFYPYEVSPVTLWGRIKLNTNIQNIKQTLWQRQK